MCVYVTDCGGLPKSGATVTVTGPGGYTATGTTDSTGHYCTPDTDSLAAGTYTVTATGGGYSPSATVTVGTACKDYVSPTLCLGGTTVCVRVVGCGGAQTGVTVSFRRSGTTVATATTDGTGKACACVPVAAGDLTATVDSPPSRYGVLSPGPVLRTALPCRTWPTITDLILPTGAGYHCLPCTDCLAPDNKPTSDTLSVSGLYGGGAHSMTYGAASGYWWYGQYTTSYPGCKDAYGNVLCPAGNLKVEFGLIPPPGPPTDRCWFAVSYTLLGYDLTTDMIHAGEGGTNLFPDCPIRTPMGGIPDGTSNVPLNSGASVVTWSSCPPDLIGTATVPNPLLPPSCTPIPNETTVTITE